MSVIGGTFDKPALIMAPAKDVQRVLERQQDTWVVFSDTYRSDREAGGDYSGAPLRRERTGAGVRGRRPRPPVAPAATRNAGGSKAGAATLARAQS